ncbi:helix-turn-helix domain-containing protein [Kribbella sp. NBC_01510]|uniref:hypothetical protein n=1 Tax=Kribbella sp. NBC_01510 TaxID=2903581 RepID=UPI003864F408
MPALKTPKTRELPDPRMEPTITINRAAAILGISYTSMSNLIDAGDAPVLALGRRRVVPTAQFIARFGLGVTEQPEQGSAA